MPLVPLPVRRPRAARILSAGGPASVAVLRGELLARVAFEWPMDDDDEALLLEVYGERTCKKTKT